MPPSRSASSTSGGVENGRRAPLLFSEEFAVALALIADAPQAGRLYPHLTVSEVRRILLRSSRFHVYYKIHEDDVIILAVWSAVRGSGPELK